MTIRTTENTNFQRQLMLVCLVFFVTFENFSHRDVTITGEGLQILTYARHLWSLSSEGSLACHTYCDMGHPFKIADALTHCASAVASKTMKLCLHHVPVSVLYIPIANKMSNYFTYSHM